MSLRTGFSPYFIAQLWYSTGQLTRVYHKERSLEELLTVKGEFGYKIVKKTITRKWLIIAHWHKDHWKMDKNYDTI